MIETCPSQTGTLPQHRVLPRPNLLLLGLGNDLLSDDAVGLHVIREIRRALPPLPSIEIQESAEMGLSLLDLVAGYSTLAVVDAVQTRQAPPGFLHELDGAALAAQPALAPHFLGLGETLALGSRLGFPMPRKVLIFAVEVADPFTMGVHMTTALTRRFPALVARILARIKTLLPQTAS